MLWYSFRPNYEDRSGRPSAHCNNASISKSNTEINNSKYIELINCSLASGKVCLGLVSENTVGDKKLPWSELLELAFSGSGLKGIIVNDDA